MIINFNKLQLIILFSAIVFVATTYAFTVGEVKGKIVPKEEIKTKSSPKIKFYNDLDYRLPQSLKPVNYDIHLHPDFEIGIFNGQETISINVVESTKQIILHSLNLNIENVYVQYKGQGLEVESYELEIEREFLIINMVNPLETNTSLELGIIFNGIMSNKSQGLYSSVYQATENEQRTIVVSKFEPTYARQAFPCFDEPAMKSTFEIVLVRPTEGNYSALSNMNVVDEKPQGDYTEVYFNKSVPMSTYLVCFIISDFVSISKTVNVRGIGDDFEVRVYAPAEKIKKAEFALNTAVAVLEYFINYYKVAYPLPKLDLVAIPDFAASAMENWGLVTFRETALLYDESYSSTWNKQSIAAVIAHELSHMWFGDLVTMNWWNEIWLNEGFARYMQYKAVSSIHTDWEMKDQFLIHTLHSVMEFDAGSASHPIIQNVESPSEITSIFDTISYDKGAAVLRMLEDAIGEEKFSEAIRNYLENFQYLNTKTDDLISELENLKLGFNVRNFLRTWTEQMGMPVIEVRRSSTAAISVTQKRFFSNIDDYNIAYNDSEFNYTWTIPLTYYTNIDSTVVRGWFGNNVNIFGISSTNETKWIKFNANQIGYYRVNYDLDMWEEIIADLIENPERFGIADRAHLLDDIFALADAGQLSFTIALDITKYLSKETDFIPWYVAVSKLNALKSKLRNGESYVDYLRYARSLLKDIYATIGWEFTENNHIKNRMCVTILSEACEVGLPECLVEASSRFENWLTEPSNKPSPDLREIVYYYGMQEVNDEDAWDTVWDLYLKEQDASEKLKLLYGLSGIKIPWILYRLIRLAEDENLVRRQDYFTCIKNIAANPVGEPIVWEYYREKWPQLVERFGISDRYLGRLITSITERFDTETNYSDMLEFFKKYPNSGAGEMSREQATERVKSNIQWLHQNEIEVAEWFKQGNFKAIAD